MHFYLTPGNHFDNDIAVRNPGNTAWVDIGDAFIWDADNLKWVPKYQRQGYGAAADTVNFYLAIALFPGSLFPIVGNATAGFTVEKLYPTPGSVGVQSRISNDNGIVVFQLDNNYDQNDLLFVNYDANVGNITHNGVIIPSFKRRVKMSLTFLDGSRQLDGTWQLDGGI